jgi:hypothetical protein
VGTYTSIAIDSEGHLHISYYTSSPDDLRYATNKSGFWVTETLDETGYVGKYTSIAIDSDDKVHISYYDESYTNLKYATNIYGGWDIYTIDNIGEVGEYSSIALDQFDNVYISYYEASNGNLKLAYKPPIGDWQITTIDEDGDVGQFCSIKIDSVDKAHISYYDATNGYLKYATNSPGFWKKDAIDFSANVGQYTSISIDPSDSIHISYYDATNGDLKHAKQSKGWQNAYNTLFNDSSDLELLRKYRDEILSNTDKGREYKKLLYKHSEDVLEVLLDNPELITQAKDLIYANILAVDDVLHGQEGVIYNTHEIEAFLDAYTENAPPRLKLFVKMVKWHMLNCQRKGKLFFGFRLE